MFLKYPHPVLCYLFFQTVSCPSGKTAAETTV
uniref:Uncharacterized protein n=1 Tax=Anguilla anguilla TaxID=7936 RepID=A0A0E9RC75_ANGAN